MRIASKLKPENFDTTLETRFPLEVMSGMAGQFAELYDKYFESEIHLFYLSFLTFLGHITSHKVDVISEVKVQPRLYMLIVGSSSSTRKSTAMEQTDKFFAEFGSNVCYGAGSAEGLEAIMEKQHNTMLYYDEFSSFIMKAKIQSSILREMVNQLFSRNKYENSVKNRQILVEDVHLSLCAATTEGVYEKIWDENFIDIGFVNRLFLVPTEPSGKSFFLVSKIPETEKDKIRNQLQSLLNKLTKTSTLSITDNAKRYWREWYSNRDTGESGKRLEEYLLRLSVLLALNENKLIIDDSVIRKAITLVDWQMQVRNYLLPTATSTTIAAMENKIVKVLTRKGHLTKASLKKYTNAERDGVWVFNTALQNEMSEGEVSRKIIGKRDFYYINKL